VFESWARKISFAVMLSASDDELRKVKSDERYITRPTRYFARNVR